MAYRITLRVRGDPAGAGRPEATAGRISRGAVTLPMMRRIRTCGVPGRPAGIGER